MSTTTDSEAIETAALRDLHHIPDAALAQALRLHSRDLAEGGFAGIAGALPASAIVVNRTIGLGLHRPADAAAVHELMATCRVAGVTRCFVHQHPAAGPALAQALQAAGLRRVRGWQKFERGTAPIARAPGGPEVRAVGAEQGAAFAALVCAAFDLGDAALAWLAQLPGRRGWQVFMAFDGAQAIGCGALFVHEGMAWFDWGATAPAHRRRGVQQALLAARVAHALALGCRRLHTCTGEAVPGDAQHSYRNILRAGFQETVLRPNWAPVD